MNKKQVKEFYKKYSKATDVKFVDKSNINFVVRLLTRFIPKKLKRHLPDMPEKFRPCAIYKYAVLPYNVGDKNINHKYQIYTAVHEATHVMQIRKFVDDGGSVLLWYEEYFKNSEFRALMESEAKAAEAEVKYFVEGKLSSPPKLDSYYVSEVAQTMSNANFRLHIDTVKNFGVGYTTLETSMLAVDILKKMANSANL